MFRFKQKNLPRLLQQAFREEAQEIELPSRQQLWTELQQRPEFAAIEKNAKQYLPQLERQKSAKTGLYAFYKKHLQQAGLIVAGLLVAILLARPIFSTIQAGPHLREQISAPEAGLQDRGPAEDRGGAAILTGKEDESTAHDNFSRHEAEKEMMTPAAETEENLQDKSARASPPPEVPEVYSFQTWEDQNPLPGIHLRNSHPDRNLRQVPKEQTFKDEEFFQQALKEARPLTAEEVWQVKSLPENFIFQEGTITRSEETLLQITQVFAEKKGRSFTLSQWFTPEKIKDETGADPDLAITQGPAQPMQVGPYRGYLHCPSPENCTLTWLQEKSIITLSGQITEEMLHQILAALENFQGKK
ncbi:MAG: hypothetical protein GX989_03720 [Firmicutes bacterium]|nr:hypothetical protein [Bacillota bacterium]